MNNQSKGVSLKYIVGAALLVVFVMAVPHVGGSYSRMVLNFSLIHAITALGISIMLGMGGQLSFASVSFMGIGAFIMANLTSGRHGFIMDSMLSLFLSISITTLLAMITGLILFRLRGTYFTFATIGLVQVMFAVFINFRPLSNGPDGISGIPAIKIFGWSPKNALQWFYVLMVIVMLVIFLVERIRRSKLGRSLASIRDNEIAAQTLGVNVYMTKVISFTIAGGLAALAGALYAMYNGFVSADLFTFNIATTYIIMVMLGGVNNTVGVFVGSLLVTMLPEWLRPMEKYLRLIFGVGVVVLMVFMPMGLAGMTQAFLKRMRMKKKGGAQIETDSQS